jgi:glycosyltransferase involved in cell wall biosynthesis
MVYRNPVIHAIHSGGFYGAERVLCDLARAQASARETGPAPVLLALLDPDQASNEIADRAEALGLEVIRLPVKPGLSLAALRAYAGALASARAGLVHSHGYKPTVLHLVSRWLGLQRLPVLVTAHGYPKGSGGWKAALYRLLDIVLLSGVESVAAVSGEMKSYLSARNPVLKPLMIPNGIPADVSAGGSHPLRRWLEERFPGSHGAAVPVIGTAGRLVPMKNQALLIRAFAKVRATQSARLVILGDGPLRPELEALWRRLLPDEPLGLIPFRPDVLEWMADMDIFALPSNDGEGLPMALLEAGLLERALVCSTSGGMPEVIRDGENGRVFAIGNEAGLAGALRDLLERPEDRIRCGAALRRDILSHHDIQVTHHRYAEAYAEILANR